MEIAKKTNNHIRDMTVATSCFGLSKFSVKEN